MSAEGIPQIAVVHGLVHRGRRLRAGDVATRRSSCASQGTIFLGGPPLVKAATGEVVTAEELGGADVHTRISGVADHLAETTRMRWRSHARIVAHLNRRPSGSRLDVREPARRRATTRASSTASCRPTRASRTTCARSSRASSTAQRFDEFKPRYGTTLVTGFARI